MALSQDQKYILASCMDSTLRLFERKTGEIVAKYEHPQLKIKDYLSSGSFSPDHCFLLSGSEAGSLLQFDVLSVSLVVRVDRKRW